MASKRPVRDLFESTVEKAPRGPLGYFGGGRAVGAIGFSVVELANNISPIPIGYKIEGRNVSRDGDKEEHEIRVWAVSKNVAIFASEVDALGPALNFVDKSTVKDVEAIRERSHHTLWEVTLEIERV